MSKILDAIDYFSHAVHNNKVSTDQAAEFRNLIQEATRKLEQVEFKTGPDYLLLKWGTWKSWESKNKNIQELMKEHDSLGLSASAMMQKENDKQKELLCLVIDLIDGIIQNDWDGDYYTKAQAKEYILGYNS